MGSPGFHDSIFLELVAFCFDPLILFLADSFAFGPRLSCKRSVVYGKWLRETTYLN